MIQAAYLAAEGFAAPLAAELARRGATICGWHGRLALSPDPPIAAAWALDIWTAPRTIAVPSVKAGADALRAIQRNWAAYPVAHARRMALIGERLPPLRPRPLAFPCAAPTGHLGGWTLLAPDRMLASPTKSSPFVNGEVQFQEDRTGPPNRAYLKLWEACVRWGIWPSPGETCLDLGAAPGGWTWALASLGARVVAVDKAPLDPRVAAMPGVAARRDSAFALAPEPVDWLFSDVVAYPGRMLALVRRWVDSGLACRIICTVKFQGDADDTLADAFAAIPGATLLHLFNNKHELTLLWSRPAA
ncbi:MAG: SAM-dependent methyltransferase [Acetobacteraceae bacterium]